MVEEIIVPTLVGEQEEPTFGRFVISPCYPGYGLTLGNALRRVLLTSLPGAAVTAMRLSGVDHEFSTIPHVKEDVVRIMLNLKGLRLKMEGDEPEATLTLATSKVGPVTAEAIKTPPHVTILNPDLVIAHLTGKTVLEMEILVERGRGYRPTEKVNVKELPIGTILLDALFSPVQRVSYRVENTRVGERVDYDQLTMEIETDGSVTPREALKAAAQLLEEQIAVFTGKSSRVTGVSGEIARAAEAPGPTVEELNLSLRTTNALLRHNIKSLADIEKLGLENLKELKGLGAKAYNEVLEVLKRMKKV